MQPSCWSESLPEQHSLDEDGLVIALKPRNNNVELHLPHTFLFQKDYAEAYENAAYAILCCTPEGLCLLTGLANAYGKTIQP